MRKTYALAVEGKNPDRVLEAVKHDLRRYLKRERARPLPEGVDFLDFDCRFGLSQQDAAPAQVAALIGLLDAAARDGTATVYVEVLAKPGHKTPRPAADDASEPASDAPAGADAGVGRGTGTPG